MCEQLVLQKMRNLVAPAAWIPPAEFQEMLRKYTDAFTVDYFVLKAKEVATDKQIWYLPQLLKGMSGQSVSK